MYISTEVLEVLLWFPATEVDESLLSSLFCWYHFTLHLVEILVAFSRASFGFISLVHPFRAKVELVYFEGGDLMGQRSQLMSHWVHCELGPEISIDIGHYSSVQKISLT